MAYTNKNLREVVCNFQFIDDGTVKWDSGYFGQFFDKIKDRGYIERQEKKGIKLNVSANSNDLPNAISTVEETESTMIFKNAENGFAITMAKAQITFHCVKDYINWDTFLKDVLIPLLDIYLQMGLYQKIQFCQVVYLNQFLFEQEIPLAEYFTIVTNPLNDIGIEGTVIVNKNYFTADIGMNVKLKSDPTPDKKKRVSLECGAASLPLQKYTEMNLIDLANITHEPIRNFFEHIITDKLRTIL